MYDLSRGDTELLLEYYPWVARQQGSGAVKAEVKAPVVIVKQAVDKKTIMANLMAGLGGL